MTFRIALFAIPAFAVVGLVFLLNRLEAPPGLFVAAYTVIAGLTGVAIGYFGDRVPGPPSRCRSHFDHHR